MVQARHQAQLPSAKRIEWAEALHTPDPAPPHQALQTTAALAKNARQMMKHHILPRCAYHLQP